MSQSLMLTEEGLQKGNFTHKYIELITTKCPSNVNEQTAVKLYIGREEMSYKVLKRYGGSVFV